MRKIWDKFVALFDKVGRDKLYHFIAGMLVAACAAIALHLPAPYALFLPFFDGLVKEGFDFSTTGCFDWRDLLATFAGGVPIWFFQIIS